MEIKKKIKLMISWGGLAMFLITLFWGIWYIANGEIPEGAWGISRLADIPGFGLLVVIFVLAIPGFRKDHEGIAPFILLMVLTTGCSIAYGLTETLIGIFLLFAAVMGLIVAIVVLFAAIYWFFVIGPFGQFLSRLYQRGTFSWFLTG